MKHSQTIGIIAAVLIISISFFPWVSIPEKSIVVSGMNAGGTDFGKPGLMNIILSVIMLLFFAIPKIWAKRTNIFIGFFNISWAIRNYILLTSCMAGVCPEKHFALFVLLLMATVMLVMSLLPKMEIPTTKNK